MKEYDYKKEYEQLLQRESNTSKEKKEIYKSLVEQKHGKYITVINWEKENNKIFDGSVDDIEVMLKVGGYPVLNLKIRGILCKNPN